MRILEIVATPVRVPRLPRFLPKTAHGESSASEYIVLELVGESGLVGLGEVTCSPRWNGEEIVSSMAIIDRHLREILIGASVSSWRPLLDSVSSVSAKEPFLRAAVEMALLDLTGKQLGVSVSELLGGARRSSIPTKAVLPARDVESVGHMATEALELGANSLKVKVGLGLDDDLRRVAAVRREVGDDVLVMVDANEGWTLTEAQRAFAELARLNVAAVEQPLNRSSSVQNAKLKSSGVLLIGDESIWVLSDVVNAASQGDFDVVSLYPGKCGGITECIRLSSVADDLGLGVTYGSNLELGIGAAALAHAAATGPATHPLTPSDIIGPLYFESSLVTDETFVAWSGASIPEGLGLGVELDRSALAHYAIPL